MLLEYIGATIWLYLFIMMFWGWLHLSYGMRISWPFIDDLNAWPWADIFIQVWLLSLGRIHDTYSLIIIKQKNAISNDLTIISLLYPLQPSLLIGEFLLGKIDYFV